MPPPTITVESRPLIASRGSLACLHADAAGVVDPVEQHRRGGIAEVLVRRLARAAPETVIVDDQHATHGEARIEVHQLMLGGLIPIRVETQQCDPAWRGARQRVLDLALAV